MFSVFCVNVLVLCHHSYTPGSPNTSVLQSHTDITMCAELSNTESALVQKCTKQVCVLHIYMSCLLQLYNKDRVCVLLLN